MRQLEIDMQGISQQLRQDPSIPRAYNPEAPIGVAPDLPRLPISLDPILHEDVRIEDLI